ncbi:5'/3'-nucleotidase SurE [Desulfothermus okinawensis JCM 13304]
MEIVITNDDGIWSVGLRALYKSLREAGHDVKVIAPLTEQSAVGHAVTLATPIRIKQVKNENFEGIGVFGTPVDCVKLGLTKILKNPPDLLISGINNGANVGVDILYSGTVAAATEAALAGVSALAVSIDNFSPEDLSDQAQFVAKLIEKIEWDRFKNRVLNLNFPDVPLKKVRGIKVCAQTQAVYRDWYEERQDPRGKPYFWLCGYIPEDQISPDSDRANLTKGYITLTPLHFDFTDKELLNSLKNNIVVL